MLPKRRYTKTISIGDLKIGGNEPIRIQSMLTSETTNIEDCIGEIYPRYFKLRDFMRLKFFVLKTFESE